MSTFFNVSKKQQHLESVQCSVDKCLRWLIDLRLSSLLQVKENTRAEKADLKLGDAIVSINGKDTSHMTLNEANRYLAKVSGGDVTLQVAK